MFWVLIIIALLLTLILAELLWLDHLFRKGFALPILAWIRKRQRDRELGDDDLFESVKKIERRLEQIARRFGWEDDMDPFV